MDVQYQPNLAGLRVLLDVGQRLLRRPVEGQPVGVGQVRPLLGQHLVDREAGGLLKVADQPLQGTAQSEIGLNRHPQSSHGVPQFA